MSATEQRLHTLVHDTANWLQRLQGIVHRLEGRLGPEDPLVTGLREGLERCAELGEWALREAEDAPAAEPARLRETVRRFLEQDESSGPGGAALRLVERGGGDAGLALPPGVLQNLLLNLVKNARAASDPSTEILLEIDPDGEPPRLRVRDAGVGMEPAELERCLEPGFRGDESPGRGLGLASVAQTLASYGGSIRLESAPGVGTTVELDLPRAAPDPPANHPSTGESHPRSLDVLVVDDEEPVREVLSVMLHEMGHRVRTVGSAREAWAALEERTPDLVLLDQALPDVPGRDVAEAFRHEKADLKLVLLTGDASTLQADRRPDSLDAIGVKPLGLEGLRSLLEEAFRDAQRPSSPPHRARPARG